MKTKIRRQLRPAPSKDWICQREVAHLLGISERTASVWASEGRLSRFCHRVPGVGRRQYSRELVERELQSRWEQAIRTQEEELKAAVQKAAVAEPRIADAPSRDSKIGEGVDERRSLKRFHNNPGEQLNPPR